MVLCQHTFVGSAHGAGQRARRAKRPTEEYPRRTKGAAVRVRRVLLPSGLRATTTPTPRSAGTTACWRGQRRTWGRRNLCRKDEKASPSQRGGKGQHPQGTRASGTVAPHLLRSLLAGSWVNTQSETKRVKTWDRWICGGGKRCCGYPVCLRATTIPTPRSAGTTACWRGVRGAWGRRNLCRKDEKASPPNEGGEGPASQRHQGVCGIQCAILAVEGVEHSRPTPLGATLRRRSPPAVAVAVRSVIAGSCGNT